MSSDHLKAGIETLVLKADSPGIVCSAVRSNFIFGSAQLSCKCISLTRLVDQPSKKLLDQPLTELLDQPLTKLLNQPLTELLDQPLSELLYQPLTKLRHLCLTYFLDQPSTKLLINRASEPTFNHTFKPAPDQAR
jgi:hypothetical protein